MGGNLRLRWDGEALPTLTCGDEVGVALLWPLSWKCTVCGKRKVLGNLQLDCHHTGNEGDPVEHVPHALFVETLDANDDKQSN